MVSITIWITCPGSTPMRARWQAATAYSAHCCACSTSWITARSPPDTLSDARNDSCRRPRRTHAPADRHHPQALAAGWRPAAYRVAYTTLGPSRHYRLDRQPRRLGQQIEDALGEGSHFGARLTDSAENQALETARGKIGRGHV